MCYWCDIVHVLNQRNKNKDKVEFKPPIACAARTLIAFLQAVICTVFKVQTLGITAKTPDVTGNLISSFLPRLPGLCLPIRSGKVGLNLRRAWRS